MSFIDKLFTADSATWEFSLVSKSANVELNPESRALILQVKYSFHDAEAAQGSFAEFTAELKALIKSLKFRHQVSKRREPSPRPSLPLPLRAAPSRRGELPPVGAGPRVRTAEREDRAGPGGPGGSWRAAPHICPRRWPRAAGPFWSQPLPGGPTHQR